MKNASEQLSDVLKSINEVKKTLRNKKIVMKIVKVKKSGKCF